MTNEKVDAKGLTCPQALVAAQRKLRRMKIGDTVEVVGTHGPSKIEIPNTMRLQGQEVLGVTEEGGVWRIVIKKIK